MNAPSRVDVALQLVKDVYLSDPEAALTLDDAVNLTQLEQYVCHALMEALTDAQFLRRHGQTFIRNGGSWRVHP